MNEQNFSLEISSKWKNWRSRYVASNNARESAYQVIREKIINLDFKPGEALSDKQLAMELEMSRTPVREALIILANSNMVIFKPQSGTFVAPIDTEWMELEQFSRYVMEKEIISLACGKMNDQLAQRYDENLKAYQSLEHSGEPERVRRMLDIDNDFHSIAFAAVGRENNFYHMLNGMQHMERMRILSIMGMSKNIINNEHQEICRAMIDGNLVSAQYWLDVHLHRYKENLKEVKEKFPEYFTLG